MKKALLFCGIFAIAAFNFLSCDDEDDNNNSNSSDNGGGTTSNLSAEFVGASDCLRNTLEGVDNEDATRALYFNENPSISYKYDSAKGEVELNLQNAVLNCAAQPKMDITFSGDTIIFTPYDADTSEIKADCVCLYNLTSKVKGVESKVYYIRPSYLRNEEDIKVLELSQKEDGVLSFSWDAF